MDWGKADMEDGIYQSRTRALCGLLGLGPESVPRWGPEELGDILRHQLRAPLLFDLRGSQDLGAGSPGHPSPGHPHRFPAPAPASFGDLLRHPSPPIELLRLTKEFAKSSDKSPDSPLPTEVAATLYYAAIVAASLRHNQSITELEPAALKQGVEWVLRRPWLDEDTRRLFEEWEEWSVRQHPGAAGAADRIGSAGSTPGDGLAGFRS